MTVHLLLRLVTAHLLTDFLLQPASWVEDRKRKRIKSVKLIWHVCLTTLVAYLFSGLWWVWWVPVVILVSHYLIDVIKSYLPDNFTFFLADQGLHIFVLFIIWLVIDKQWNVVVGALSVMTRRGPLWLYIFGYTLVTWPLGVLIGKATTRWRDDIETSEESKEGLANAGKWIGICERALILTFVLTNQYTAIGFLITAKSILRFNDKNAQKKTEYILVGTLLSFAASALIGVIISSCVR